MKKKYRKLYSSDAVLKMVAELLRQETENHYIKKMEAINEVFHIEPDQKFLEFAREFDKDRNAGTCSD